MKIMKSILLAATVFALPEVASANGPGSGDFGTYYRYGGGAPAPAPISSHRTFNFRVGAGGDYSLGNMCGNFDPSLNFEVAMGEAFDQTKSAALAGLQSLGLMMAMHILAETRPTLYDFIKDHFGKANAFLDIGVKRCETMAADVEAGRSPMDGYILVGNNRSVARAAQSGTVGITEAIRDKNSDAGITWAGGEDAGGVGQPPIRVVSDVVQAGYNGILNRSALETAPAPAAPAGSPQTPIKRFFPTPAKAQEFVTNVLGDVEISLAAGGQRVGVPGFGLLPEYDKQLAETTALIGNLYSRVNEADYAEFAAASAPGVEITPDLLRKIREELPSVQQGYLLDKLSSDTALAITLHKAMMARQLLLAGRKESNVANVGQAQEDIQLAIEELDGQIDNLIRYNKIRTDYVSPVALGIYEQALGSRVGGIKAGSGSPETSSRVDTGTGAVIQ
ncbi:MAG: hypothetical protein ACR2PS_00495 [Pseudomonadales bacterium]